MNVYDTADNQQLKSSIYMQLKQNSCASFISTVFPFQQQQQQPELQQQFIIQFPINFYMEASPSIYSPIIKNIPFPNPINTVPLCCIYIPVSTTYQLPVMPNNPSYNVFLRNMETDTDKNSNSGFTFFNPLKLFFNEFPQSCPANYYRCNDGTKCILKLKWCDNKIDCPDASDEIKCTCRDRINPKKLCDYFDDCPHGEDELGCFGCPKNSISCNDISENCISLEERCNENAICQNGKDERNCNILTESFAYESQLIPVGSSTGFLKKNVRGRWYLVCGYAYPWAKDACTTELGSLRGVPEIELVWISDKSSMGPYLSDDGGSGKSISECLYGIAYVRCPISTSDTGLYQPFYTADPYEVGSKQVNSTRNETSYNPIVGIVGGHNSLPRAWPFVVAINKNGHFHCGGIILNEWWILTAAHCFHNHKYNYYDIDAGVLRRFSYSPTRQTRHLTSVIVHENYNSFTLQNDIALGVLDKSLYFNSWVRPARLPRSDDYDKFFELKQQQPWSGQRCVAVGWGATKEGGSDFDHLQEVELAIIECKQPHDRNRAEICAGFKEGGRDACQGDSGGPLMCRVSNWNYDWYVGGIVSHGIGCGRRNQPGAYTKVAYFHDWINNIIYNRMGSKGAQRLRSTCPGFSCNESHPKCLPSKQRCDGVVNCLEAEDEINCPNFTIPKLLDRLLGIS